MILDFGESADNSHQNIARSQAELFPKRLSAFFPVGKHTEVESQGNLRVVRGTVPIAEMFAYSSALRGATQGRGSYSMELHEYRDVPRNIAEKILKGVEEK